MNTTVRRALWVVLVLLCLGLVFLALRGVLAVGAVPISAAPTLSATASATPSPKDISLSEAASTRSTGSGVSLSGSSRCSSGLRSSSASTKSSSSRFDSCSSLIACCSWGVMTSPCPCLTSSL